MLLLSLLSQSFLLSGSYLYLFESRRSISNNLGYGGSIEALKECYAGGVINKDEFAAALRAHQAAIDATKSPRRDRLEKLATQK